MTDDELRFYILRTIGECCDEVSLSGNIESFCEMDQGVFHVVVDGHDRYFRVDLIETTEDHYFDRILPRSMV